MTDTSTQYTITPLTPMTTLDALQGLIGGQFQARAMIDPVHSHDLFIGEITQVKITKWSAEVYFKTPALNRGAWIKLERVVGWAHQPDPVPAAAEMTVAETREHIAALAEDFPHVALDVLIEYDAAVAAKDAVIDAPVAAAQPAHMTDSERETGLIGYYSAAAGYGYVDAQGSSFRFDRRNVYGDATTLTMLRKGAAVTFTIRDAIGASLSAVAIVVSGNEASETAYARYVALKANKASEPLPRPRRNRDINANTFTSLKLS